FANLQWADLTGANCFGCDLRYANLHHAKFT
ncbi:MAG: pentapeptide repeat-containing protein, partial [Pseudanabaena sp.]